MAHLREKARSASKKQSRSSVEGVKRVRVRAMGAPVEIRAGAAAAEAPPTKDHFNWVADMGRVIGEMISSYAAAAAKAAQSGKPYTLTYTISPDGKAEAVTEAWREASAEDSLDAALAKAKARGATKVTEILKSEDMLTARDFGPLIGASHETVNVKRKRHDVLGLEGGTRGVKYPRWQVTDAGLPLPGLARLFAVLGEQPWTVYRFLRAEHAELGGRTALDALKAGQIDAVVGVAETQGAGAFV